jgi:hypothetical protein
VGIFHGLVPLTLKGEDTATLTALDDARGATGAQPGNAR